MVVGIAHAGLAPEIEIGGVRPNLILVAVVLVTALLGFGPGVVWAFAGGLTANLISTTPWLYPILAAFAGSMLADLVIVGVFRLLSDAVSVGVPIELMLPAAVLNAGIAGLLLYPARVLTRRLVLEEKPAW